MSRDPSGTIAAEPAPSRLARALGAADLAEWSVALPSGRWLVASGLDDVYGPGAPDGAEAAAALAAPPGASAEAASPLTTSVLGDCLHAEDRSLLVERYERLAASGEPLQLELRINRTDGEPRWIRVDGEVSARDEEGVPMRLSGHVRDVTELKRLRLANGFLAELSVPLAQLDDYDDTLQRVASDTVPFLADRCIVEFVLEDGSLQRVADSHLPPLATRSLPPERSAERVPGAPLIERIVSGRQSLVLGDIGEAEIRGLSATEEQRLELEGFQPCDYIGTPLESGGRCFGVLGILTRRDGRRFASQEIELVERVADRIAAALENARLYATLREADERKTHYLAVLSHELRNPFAAIVAGLDAIRDSVVGPAERATLTMVDRQAVALGRLLDDLLDAARVDADKVDLSLEWVSVARAVDDAAASVGPAIRGKRQRLSVKLPEPDIAVRADPTRLEQILVNLLTNASRYTPEGGSVTLAARGEDGRIVVDVVDTGIGLGEDQRQRIFERFEQVHDDVVAAPGLGLGLSLVRALVSLHGGTIDVDSAGRGHGSRFRLTLPHTRSSVSGNGAASGAEAAAEPSRERSVRVLLIDDNRDAAGAVRRVLGRLGHEVASAETGEAGLRAYRAAATELVLLDIGLPDLDGYAVAERIREHERAEGLPACHLVALTGYGQARDRERALAAGFDEHIVKPVRVAGLRALAARARGRRDADEAG